VSSRLYSLDWHNQKVLPCKGPSESSPCDLMIDGSWTGDRVKSALDRTRTQAGDCRYEHCDITCGTRHVHVRWRNLCVYDQVTSPKWRHWSTRTSETFATVSVTSSPTSPPSVYISMVHHDDIYVVSFHRVFVCGYVLSWCMCVCMIINIFSFMWIRRRNFYFFFKRISTVVSINFPFSTSNMCT
jgi:hypothetical protein